MKKQLLITLVIFLHAAGFSQVVEEKDGFYLLEVTAAGEREETALSNAVDKGVDTIFSFIRKDDLFRDMFLSSWPEAVNTVTYSIEPAEEGYSATAVIQIDKNTILLAEPNYRNTVRVRLDSAEESLPKLDTLIESATGAEEEGNRERAFLLYSQSVTYLKRLSGTLDGIEDMSVLSIEGNNIQYFRSRIRGYAETIDAGIKRIETARQEAEEREKEKVALEEEKEKEAKRTKLKEVFMKKQRDRLVLRWQLPFSYRESQWDRTGSKVSLTAEKAFDGGVWARGVLNWEKRVRISDGGLSTASYAQAAIGFWSRRLYGAGLGWTWHNTDISEELYESSNSIQEPVLFPSIFWGVVDSSRRWPVCLVEYRYGIPSAYLSEYPTAAINGSLKLTVRGEDYILLTGEIWSLPVNSGNAVSQDHSHLVLSQGLQASGAFRFPGPFAAGIIFSGSRHAEYTSSGISNYFSPMIWSWSGYIQYSY